MRRFAIFATMLFVATVCLSSHVRGSLIDFETDPAAALPVDDTPLTVPYGIPGGNVQFFFDNNANNNFDLGTDSYPVFEHIGADGNEGFANGTLGLLDTAAPGFGPQLGTFFLRGPVGFAVPNPFIVDYNTTNTISALSGEIWDIDGGINANELWRVDVLDSLNIVLASQLSPLGNSLALDGKPWVFSFTGLPLGVDKVRLTFLGTKTQGVGLAFNNFSPTEAVPEPSSVLLAAIGGGVLLGALARRRHRSHRA